MTRDSSQSSNIHKPSLHHKVNEDKILFFVDLENETVVAQRDPEAEVDMEEELDSSLHPVLIN